MLQSLLSQPIAIPVGRTDAPRTRLLQLLARSEVIDGGESRDAGLRTDSGQHRVITKNAQRHWLSVHLRRSATIQETDANMALRRPTRVRRRDGEMGLG